MPPEPASHHDRHGGHSGQWGLAAFLLSGLIIVFFPMMTALILGLLIGMWNINEVERRHIEFSVIGLQVVVYGLLCLALFALLSGLLGLIRATSRRQPFGLALGGTLTAAFAVAVSVILIGISRYAIEDTRRLFAEHSRFQPASKKLIEEVKAEVEKKPLLKPMYDKALSDGEMTEYEANAILVRAGTRVYLTKRLPFE